MSALTALSGKPRLQSMDGVSRVPCVRASLDSLSSPVRDKNNLTWKRAGRGLRESLQQTRGKRGQDEVTTHETSCFLWHRKKQDVPMPA